MLLCLRSVAAVVPPRLLSFHPQVDQLLKLTNNKLSKPKTHNATFRSYPRLLIISVFIPAREAPREPHRSWWPLAAVKAICGEWHLQSPQWKTWRCRSRRNWRGRGFCLLAPGAGFHMCCFEHVRYIESNTKSAFMNTMYSLFSIELCVIKQ